MPRARRAPALTALLALAAAGRGREPEPPPEPPTLVVMVTVDQIFYTGASHRALGRAAELDETG